MPVLETLVGGGVFGLLNTVVERIWPDKNKADEIKLQLFKAQQEGLFKELDADLQRDLAQAEINKAEAQNPNLFVSGWRPCIGWACAGLIVWSYLGAPLLNFFCPDKPLPALPIGALFELVLAMLGVAGLRTAEKWRGVAAK